MRKKLFFLDKFLVLLFLTFASNNLYAGPCAVDRGEGETFLFGRHCVEVDNGGKKGYKDYLVSTCTYRLCKVSNVSDANKKVLEKDSSSCGIPAPGAPSPLSFSHSSIKGDIQILLEILGNYYKNKSSAQKALGLGFNFDNYLVLEASEIPANSISDYLNSKKAKDFLQKSRLRYVLHFQDDKISAYEVGTGKSIPLDKALLECR